MSIRAGVIVAVTFQQVDRAPNTKTGSKSHDESLQYTDCTVEKCHKLVPPFEFRGSAPGDRLHEKADTGLPGNKKALVPHVHLREKGIEIARALFCQRLAM